jgi:hypothetical protein
MNNGQHNAEKWDTFFQDCIAVSDLSDNFFVAITGQNDFAFSIRTFFGTFERVI